MLVLLDFTAVKARKSKTEHGIPAILTETNKK